MDLEMLGHRVTNILTAMHNKSRSLQEDGLRPWIHFSTIIDWLNTKHGDENRTEFTSVQKVKEDMKKMREAFK
jgi:hypothetical protein